MTPILGDYLTNLAGELSAHVLAHIPAWVQAAWQGDETDMAVRRGLDAGLAAFMRRAKADAPAYAELWELIFPRFFRDEQVAGQVVRLLEGQPLNRRALQFMAAGAGYQAERFPELDFDAALQEFEGAFLIQATHEPTLQGILEANQLLQQTKLLAETRALLERIVALLQQIALQDIVGITADSITATNVVSGVQNIYHLAPAGGAPNYPSHWESHYLKALITRCSGLDLTTLSAGEATADSLSIAAVFTTLYLEGVGRAADEAVTDVLRPAEAPRVERDGRERAMPQPDKERLPITATEAVAGVRRLVILGRPGGGKSTLVNHIATQLARQRRGDEDVALPGWPAGYAPLPVRIILRRFADWLAREGRRGESGDVWAYLAYLLERWGCADSAAGVRETLISHGGIFFFDGLDEIRDAPARRAVLKGAVAEFAAMEAQCQVVVTSRPYAYAAGARWRLPDDEFVVVDLAPFGQAQIEAFNKAWYTRVMGPRRDWSTEQCELRAARLSRTILARPHLQRLAESPLLLTLMAQVDSSGTEAMLPNNRAELYRQTVDLLLARWENRIQLDDNPAADVPDEQILWLDGLPTQELRDILAKLAYDGHRAQGQQDQQTADDGPAVEIRYEQLRDALLVRFDSLARVEEIIIYIQHRTGLLVDKGEGVFTFPHRTYQEYLAGQHLQNTFGWQARLIKHVREAPDWWREVFLLSAASMTVADSIQFLVQALLPVDQKLTQRNVPWVMIAAQALVETNFGYYVALEQQQKAQEPQEAAAEGEGFTAFYQRVQNWLKAALVAEAVLPPQTRAEAGRWLAQLGDDRPGVGIDPATGLPDIVWSAEIPAGTYTIGGDKQAWLGFDKREVLIKQPYCLARYPVTYAQFQCFVDAPDFDDERWWRGMPGNAKELREQASRFTNHPRDMVSWYQAMAFCRWLTARLHTGELPAGALTGDVRQYEITLPHEYEWEVAARWPNSDAARRLYPWGAEFDAAKANMAEGGIRQTTAVGIYPAGRNAALELYDLSGNVGEWCRNKYDNPEDEAADSAWRMLRGGSWGDDADSARTAFRYARTPAARNYDVGFRLVVVGGGASSPIS